MKPRADGMEALRAKTGKPRRGLNGIRQGFSPTEECDEWENGGNGRKRQPKNKRVLAHTQKIFAKTRYPLTQGDICSEAGMLYRLHK